jgi:hypothetical protein
MGRRLDGNWVLLPTNAPRSSMLLIYLPSQIHLELLFLFFRHRITKPHERINDYHGPRENIVQFGREELQAKTTWYLKEHIHVIFGVQIP